MEWVALDSLVAVRNSSPGQPEPCEGNLVAAAGSCGGLMVKHPWPLLEISLSDFRRLATLNIYTYLPTLIAGKQYRRPATDKIQLRQGGKFMEIQAALARGKLGAKEWAWAEFIVIFKPIHFTPNLPILPQ